MLRVLARSAVAFAVEAQNARFEGGNSIEEATTAGFVSNDRRQEERRVY